MAVEITDELVALRAEAEALGVMFDGRWGEARLREEIAVAQTPGLVESEGTGEPMEGIEYPADGTEHELSTPAHAGGHIDRGDGRGWVVEE